MSKINTKIFHETKIGQYRCLKCGSLETFIRGNRVECCKFIYYGFCENCDDIDRENKV